MLRVGLTGGIGSGKTTVSDYFHSLYKIPVIDADKISRELMDKNGKAYAEIVALLGPECLLESGQIDRKFIRDKVFSDAQLRRSMEQIIHPRVKSAIISQSSNCHSVYCLIVVPLLIESDMQSLVDRVLVIDTSRENQLKRVSARDACPQEQVDKIIQTQIDSNIRLQCADDIIINNGDAEDLIPQIHALHHKYLNLSQ